MDKLSDELIDQVIREGIVEKDGYRYSFEQMDLRHGFRFYIKRINLQSLNDQYDIEHKTADQITGWEYVATVDRIFD